MLSKKNKKGNILTENVIFFVLNLTYITILLVFLFSKTGDASNIEEKYAKQIALIIDAAEPGMIINLKMEDAIKRAVKEEFPLSQIVKINGNLVTVKIREDTPGYSYSFFNDVEVNANFDSVNKNGYYFVITKNE